MYYGRTVGNAEGVQGEAPILVSVGVRVLLGATDVVVMWLSTVYKWFCG